MRISYLLSVTVTVKNKIYIIRCACQGMGVNILKTVIDRFKKLLKIKFIVKFNWAFLIL